MNFSKPITSELQAKIDALPDEKLRSNILQVLRSPGKKITTNEKIFENMVNTYHEVIAQRALWRKWHDNEVIAFVEYFKQEIPEDYAEFLRQERDDNEIDDDLWWRAGRLADNWIPDLDFEECSDLLGKVRDYMRAHLITEEEQS